MRRKKRKGKDGRIGKESRKEKRRGLYNSTSNWRIRGLNACVLLPSGPKLGKSQQPLLVTGVCYWSYRRKDEEQIREQSSANTEHIFQL